MITEESIIAELCAEFCARSADQFDVEILSYGSLCESPIEKVLFAAFVVEKERSISFYTGELRSSRNVRERCESPFEDLFGALYIQAPLGPYRVDFYLEAFDWDSEKRLFATAIECDGHDFHERTKEQARRDKARDRWLQQHGIAVFRFTGSEIWENPLACASQVFAAMRAAVRRIRGY